ncbi:DUF6221 family protein [Streptomyces sp. ZG43]
MTASLIAFLQARLDEDEEEARAATQGDWVWSREFVTPPGYHHRTVGPLEPGDAAHIARHNPARALAEVEAKRRIVRAHEKWCAGRCEAKYPEGGFDAAHYWSVKSLAATYADHPDYREEWRP